MTSQKFKKRSPSRQEPTNTNAYPDWAAMQAYYGPGVPMPPPYMSSPMMSGHSPHQMWGSTQGVMPPYGVPYQAVYPPGVIYAHPAIPLVAAPASPQQPSKVSDKRNKGLTKKVKRLETISTPVSNDGDDIDEEDSSWSQDQGLDAACDFSDVKVKYSQDDRHLKREKRKQANRESARKSRMRKQAEVEELMVRYEALKTENSTLSFEMHHLVQESEKLRVENATLMEKLGDDEMASPEDMGHGKYELGVAQPNHTRDELMTNNLVSFSGDESES